jgi:DNA-nicking Smr family endonuclease
MPTGMPRNAAARAARVGLGTRQGTSAVAASASATASAMNATSAHLALSACALEDSAVKLKLDLHEIYNRGDEIERALRGIIDEAIEKKAPLVEIIPGKGSGQLKKRVLRFLDRKDIKGLYHRVEKDSDNFGRVFVHFKWK